MKIISVSESGKKCDIFSDKGDDRRVRKDRGNDQVSDDRHRSHHSEKVGDLQSSWLIKSNWSSQCLPNHLCRTVIRKPPPLVLNQAFSLVW